MENLNTPGFTRRKFLGAAAAALFTGVVITITGCNSADALAAPGDGSNPVPNPNPGNGPSQNPAGTPNPNQDVSGQASAAGDRSATVAGDPTHSAIVTAAQQTTGGALTLNIMGTSPHNHTVSLTAQDVADIKNGVQVVKTSSTTQSHNHVVTFAAVTPDRSAAIATNHGHVATVTGAQQDAGGALTLNIQGTADHNHTVALTTTDMSNIKAGAQVVKTSSNVGHDHVVTFNPTSTSIVMPRRA